MINSLLTGFFLGISLIVAIGAQNAFVLRQGILRKHIFYVVLFCAFSDALLISIGITGISFFFNKILNEFTNILFGISSIWLGLYGLIRLRSALKFNSKVDIEISSSEKLLPTIMVAAILTFANPHVYLDTMILIGTISQQFTGNHKIWFGIGACLASFTFFFSLGYGAQLLTPLMNRPISWKILDGIVSIIMFTLAFRMVLLAGWL